MPFGIQPIHLLVIALVALIIFGPSRLPEIGRGLGRALTEFRKGAREMTEGFREEVSRSVGEEGPTAAAVPSQPRIAGGNFCTSCGAANPADARYCNQCGTQLPV